MPWGRVDDDFYDHPKVKALPVAVRNAACGLYWRAVSYSNRYLTDGRLSEAALLALDATPETITALANIAPGMHFGLFEKCPGMRSGYRVHDFLDRNKSRAQVEAEREIKANSGRLGGIKSGESRRAAKHETKQPASRDEADGKQPASSVLHEAHGKQSASSPAREARSKREAPGVELPSRPVPLSTSTPTPLGAVAAQQPPGESFEATGPRLTRAAFDGWARFEAKEWEPFKAAWLARGFLLPPFGDATDDADTSQRARLWRIADDQPKALGRWVSEAPGKTAHDVLAYVFGQRAKLAAEIRIEEAEVAAKAEAGAEDGERKRRAPQSPADTPHDDDWISGGRP